MRKSVESMCASAGSQRGAAALSPISLVLASCSVVALAAFSDDAMARKRDREAEAPPVAAKAADKNPASLGPLIAVVSKGSQDVTIYNNDGRVMRASVSTGQPDHPTPLGVFAVIAKERMHFSNLYGDAPMPFMQRITWSGVAMHAGNLPGYPASHGCVRMPPGFAADLYGKTKIGMRVVITKGDPAPVAISHANLFVPKLDDASLIPAADSASVPPAMPAIMKPPMGLGVGKPIGERLNLSDWLVRRQDAKVAAAAAASKASKDAASARADADYKIEQRNQLAQKIRAFGALADELGDKIDQISRQIETAKAPEASVRLDATKQGLEGRRLQAVRDLESAHAESDERASEADKAVAIAEAAEAVRITAVDAARDATRRLEPVSVFISRKTQKLYVRQAFSPVFDAPITLSDPGQPIGTFVYTAMRFDDATNTVAWKVLATGADVPKSPSTPAKRGASNGLETASLKAERSWPVTATSALDRIDIPADVRDKIAQMMSPGSSLIISDEPVSNETGKGTDFVILTH